MKSQKPRRGSKDKPLTDMERFFDLFAERQLAADLFTVCEDARVDMLVKREYSGIRRSYARMQTRELDRRPFPRALPLRQAFVENLVRASLDGFHSLFWPRQLNDVLLEGLRILQQLRRPEALVEDAAEAALRLYSLAMSLPNLPVQDIDGLDWDLIDGEGLELMLMSGGGRGGEPAACPPSGPEEEYGSPSLLSSGRPPELVQLLMRPPQEGQKVPKDGASPPISANSEERGDKYRRDG
jgi:hypothetical protein